MAIGDPLDRVWINAKDDRPPKHGWSAGHYSGKCRNCGQPYIGEKNSYHCADCAYDFDEQLEYERLWRKVGFCYTADYLCTKIFGGNRRC